MINPSTTPGSPHLLEAYQLHLLHVAGLAEITGHNYCQAIHRFLNRLGISGDDVSSFKKITPLQIRTYCFELLEDCPKSVGHHSAALRSFFRYLQLQGFVADGHQYSFPSIRRKSDQIKVYLSESQVRHLLKPKHFKGPQAKRDRAIVLLAARLGLRAGEIARVTLEDINWRECTLRLRKTKGRRERVMPIPSVVTKGLIAHLRQAQNREAVREVFLSSKRVRPLSSSSVSTIAKKAFAQAGITVARTGAHLLRHTLATQLVQKGADLKAVADVLGHQHLSTTTRYTKVNLPMLLQMVTPWPEELA